jgi:hypothetical protein
MFCHFPRRINLLAALPTAAAVVGPTCRFGLVHRLLTVLQRNFGSGVRSFQASPRSQHSSKPIRNCGQACVDAVALNPFLSLPRAAAITSGLSFGRLVFETADISKLSTT